MVSASINVNDQPGIEKAKGRTAITDSLAKLARTALVYPVRFVGSTATETVEFSPIVYALNVLAMMTLVVCGYGSLLGELNSFRTGQSKRFKNGTVAVVSCLCYTMLVLPCTIAVFGSASRHVAWLDIERLLDRVDEALDNRSYTAADKRVERCVILLVLIQVVVSAVDYYIWIMVDPANKSYCIVYMFQHVNLVSLAMYAQLAWCIGRRFDIVNREIEVKLERMTTSNHVQFPNRRYQDLFYLLHCSSNRIKDVKYIPIKKFQEIYWDLCCSVNILNHEYGCQLLTSLLMNIIRLIVVPNILLTRVLKTVFLGLPSYGSIIGLIGCVFYHLAFLFLMVLPTSYAATRAQTTAVIICKHLNGYLEPNDMNQLKLFVLQLQKNKVNFSIYGMIDLQTSTITKVIGTTITYLLIFIQLQNK